VRPVDLDRLGAGEKIVAGTGIVLVVDLAFLPWQSVDLGLTTFTRSAIESPNAVLGVLALLLAGAVVAVTLLRALPPEKLPEPSLPGECATSLAAAGVLALLVAKLVAETDALGIGAWLGVVLAAGMAAGAALEVRADAAVSRRAPPRSDPGERSG
jgi:hypothetical protein